MERRVREVLDVYSGLVRWHPKAMAAELGLNYNTLKSTVKEGGSLKLSRLYEAACVLFPEVEPGIHPDVPRRLERHLTRDELVARMVAAALDDPERLRRVGAMLTALAEGRLPSLAELERL